MRHRRVRGLLLLTILGMGATYTVYAYSSPATGEIGLSRSAAVFMLFLYGVGAVLGTLARGHVADRYGPRRVLFGNYTTMAVAILLFAEAATQHPPRLAIIGLSVLLWGATYFAQTPPQQHRLIALAPGQGALLLSLNASVIYLGIGLGTMLSGIGLVHGAEVILLTAGAMATLVLSYPWRP